MNTISNDTHDTSPLRAYVYAGGNTQEYWIENSPNNIARFLMHHASADKTILTDVFDRFVLSSFGCFLDRCDDKDLLMLVLTELVPMQRGSQAVEPPVYLEQI